MNFSGRASRSEFWWATLFLAIVYLPLSFLAIVMGDGHLDLVTGRYVVGPGYYLVTGLTWLWSLAVLLPSLSLTWRRLHDTNRSGLLYLLVLIPFVGVFIVFILVLLNSNPAGARFDRPEA